MKTMKLRADFNGLFGDILCLSHGETCMDEEGREITLRAGMSIIAYDEDADERGERDDLCAAGTVEPAPDWLRQHGAKWILRIDERGVWHESDAKDEGR